jgi:hypothetical protein
MGSARTAKRALTMRPSANRAYIFGCIVWLVSIGAGFSILAKYNATQGEAASPQDTWPIASALIRPSNTDFLLMFVHPQCPCSTASIGELNRLMASCQGRLAVSVMFVKPPGMSPEWEKSALWKSAGQIPGVNVACDDGGIEAARFDASTSGQTFLYSADGKLLFRGGITASRGHAGDNAGSDAIALLVNGQTSAVNHTPVFGCSLSDPSDLRKAICRH